MDGPDFYDPRQVAQIECDHHRTMENHELGKYEDGVEHEFNTLEMLDQLESELEQARGKPARLVAEEV